MLDIGKSPAAINKVMNILKQIFDFAMALMQIRTNPCSGFKKPSIRKTKKKTWDEKTISRFLNLKDTKESSAYTALLILFSTGMRPGEVCGLRWCDWMDDYFLPAIGIDSKREETELKNEKAHESVYSEQHVNSELPDEYFINCLMLDFLPMTVDYLRKTFNKIVEKNNLPRIRLYDSRHSLGTNIMRNCINPKEVSEILRHTSVKTTLDNYSHVNERM